MIYLFFIASAMMFHQAPALSVQLPKTRLYAMSIQSQLRLQGNVKLHPLPLRPFTRINLDKDRNYERRKTKHLNIYKMPRPSMQPVQSSSTADGMDEIEESTKDTPFLPILWRFTRPHTIIGSALAIPALHIYSLSSYSLLRTHFGSIVKSALYAMIPALLMNLYITGLNQITDVEIDKINKPDLVLASGELSHRTAIKIVLVALLTSLTMGLREIGGLYATQGLNVALWGSCILGTAYSLPPIRLKRFPQFAAFCIIAVRGAIINAGFYAHAKAVMGGSSAVGFLDCLLEKRCLLSSLWFSGFGLVIALMKDVPDARGDALFNIRSFTVRIGTKNVLKAMRRLLASLFLGVGILFTRGAASSIKTMETSTVGLGTVVSRCIVAVSSIFAAYSVREESKKVDDADVPTQVYDYYMFLWKLFYISYLILPFAR